MSTLELKVYEIFKSKLGDSEAEILINYFNSMTDQKITEKKDLFATNEDLANMKADIIKWMFIFWVGQLGALVAIIKLIA